MKCKHRWHYHSEKEPSFQRLTKIKKIKGVKYKIGTEFYSMGTYLFVCDKCGELKEVFKK